jgi:deoxyribodipyrimidine photo-lyase
LALKAKHHDGAAAFFEECVVRRELSDNFCYYNHKYDSLDGLSAWAKETLEAHSKDKREYVYSDTQFGTVMCA